MEGLYDLLRAVHIDVSKMLGVRGVPYWGAKLPSQPLTESSLREGEKKKKGNLTFGKSGQVRPARQWRARFRAQAQSQVKSNLHANIGGPFQGAGAKCI